VRAIAPLSGAGGQRAYRLPAADGATVDAANDLIIARWQGRVYAFSLRCPHRGTRLEWHADEARIFCPKHKARFRPDGAHDSGRSTRDLDRYGVRRQGEELIVNFAILYRADQNAAAWEGSTVQVA
jgi:nitrite reductase/ring-hydroxylating ferredoxin subunit